jgi:Cu-Zn family superoxide dismutase
MIRSFASTRLAGVLAAGVVCAAAVFCLICNEASTAAAADAKPTTAVAEIHNAAAVKDKITGTVTFTDTDKGVHIVAEIDGLKPGKHGFHVHQSADLSAPDLKSAGGHFNPGGTKHGGPDSEMHHAGDLGNLVADEKGHATLDRVFAGLSVSGEKDGVIGHSVVIHAGEDDLKSDPAGNSGARIAAGPIVAAPAK